MSWSHGSGKYAGCKIARDKVNLDIFWLRDESLEDSANLPDPDILAVEIMEDLRAALDQFSNIAGELSPDSLPDPSDA